MSVAEHVAKRTMPAEALPGIRFTTYPGAEGCNPCWHVHRSRPYRAHCRHQAVLADKGFAGLVLGFPKLKHQVCEDDEDILLVSPDGTLLTFSESH